MKKAKTNVKAKARIHWLYAPPFNRTVFSLVGDPGDGLRQIGKVTKDPKCWADNFSSLVEDMPKDQAAGLDPFCKCGRAFLMSGGDILMWFPRYPHIGVLMHELLHAVHYICELAGVKDTEHETDAYLLAYLGENFIELIGDDIRRDMPKERWI